MDEVLQSWEEIWKTLSLSGGVESVVMRWWEEITLRKDANRLCLTIV